jgi:hypothetical protein
VTLGAIRVFDGTDWSSSLATGGISGSGTTNYLARWTPSGSALGNSVVQDDGTQVHVGGTPTSSTMLKVTPVDKYGIYVDSDQNTSSVISAYIADIANTGTGNIEAIYSTSAGSNDASANVSLFHSNGVTAGTQANSYGLYLTAHTAGTAKWGIYQAGANDKNYFAGAMQFDTAAAATGYVWTATDADGNGDWAVAASGGLSDVVDDITPQLGGSLDVNGQKIVSVAGGNIDIEPNGTGNVLLGNFTFDADQTVGAGQDNYVLTYDNATGLISLEAAAGGGGGLWTDDSGGKISYSASGAAVQVYETGFANTYGSAVTLRRGIFVVGEANTIGDNVTATTVGRTAVFGGNHTVGNIGTTDYAFTAGYNNTIEEGLYNIAIGNDNEIKNTTDSGISIGTVNTLLGSKSIIIGDNSETQSGNAIIIGQSVRAGDGSKNQVALGKNFDVSHTYYSNGFYVDFGSAISNRPTFALTKATGLAANAPLNMSLGSDQGGRNDGLGAGSTNAGSGVFWHFARSVTEPTANLTDGVALYVKDRIAGRAGYMIKAENGTQHYFSDFSAIGGDETVATANKTLTVAGTGTTSGTSSLVAENSAGTVGLEVRDDLVVVMPNLPTSSAGLPTGGLWNNSGVINIV